MIGKRTLWLAVLLAVLSAAGMATFISASTDVYAGPPKPGGNTDG